MFQTPSKLKINKLLQGRTLSFETPSNTHGNMVIIPTLDKKTFTDTVKSKLFRPMQMLALYTPRKVKPIGRSVTIINQKDYYSDIRTQTDGRIRKGKTLIAAYNAQNLIYDIFNDYKLTGEAFSSRKQSFALQNAMISYFEDMIERITDDPDYPDCFLVFPIEKGYDNPNKIFRTATDRDTLDPLALFVASIIRDQIHLEKYKKIKRVLFYVPNGEVLLVADLKDPEFKKKIWPSLQQKIIRMNNFVLGTDNLADEIEDEEHADITPEEKFENNKEKIKQVMLSKVAKTIHANNLDDFEAASRDERDLMVTIDSKIDKYLAKPENLKKTFNDMAEDIEKDDEVKVKAIRYVETKKASINRMDSFAKGIEKETEIIGSLQDLDDPDDVNEADKFKVDVPFIDEKIKTSRLSSFDDQYNKKQRMKDITNVVSGFSNAEYSPLVVDSFTTEDTSNDQDEKVTMKVRYKTDDGKTLSFQLDVPKIKDKRFFYLNGNKKVIKKQIVRLPIVKTKPDRVEITTNVNKMTIERSSGKLSRKNSYLLKKLKEIENNPAFEIEYRDSHLVNSKFGYSNDFEYEELGSNIFTIKSLKYFLVFNRDEMKREMDLLDIPEDFITPKRTPLGFEIKGDEKLKLIYIEDQKIFEYSIAEKTITKIKDELYTFLVEDVLKLDMSILPSIGNKNFVYTTVKFLTETYPMLAMVASQKGLTNILTRYGVKYYKTEKEEKNNVKYVGVKFKDCYLYYEDTMRNTLLLNALYLLHPEDFNYSDFDIDTPYTRYFMEKSGDSVGIHTRNTLRINLGVIIDPITRDVLRDLRQPTDIIDVLLYANTLLVGNQYKTQNDMTNYRVRGNELVADVMYAVIAKAYVAYCKHKINGRPTNLEIPKNALIRELMMEPNVNDKTVLNPTLELEQVSQASAKGHRGVNLNKQKCSVI